MEIRPMTLMLLSGISCSKRAQPFTFFGKAK
jgi:hypothetical protein